MTLDISGQCAWAKNSFTKNIPQIEPNFSYIQPIHICRTVFLHIFSKFSSNMTFSAGPIYAIPIPHFFSCLKVFQQTLYISFPNPRGGPLWQTEGGDISAGNFSNPLSNFQRNMVYCTRQNLPAKVGKMTDMEKRAAADWQR